MSALAEAVARLAGASAPAVVGFLERHEFPLVQGTTVVFAWRGRADEVHLVHWIHGLSSGTPFVRMPGTDVWFLVQELPEGSRVEYKLEIVERGERRLIQDPRNRHLASDPFGANSVVHAAGYEEPDWSQFDPEARPGTIEEHSLNSSALGGLRSFQLYLPARYRPRRRYPLLIVHDGPDYLRFAQLKLVLDNLIHRLEIPSLIVALTSAGNRLREYADDECHARFLAEELLPTIEGRWSTIGTPQARGLMGASFGAVASLSTAWRYPGKFGNLLLQSGSFVFTDIGEHGRGSAFDPVVRFVNQFRREPGRPADQVYLSCGQFESMIYYHRSILPVLQRTGMVVRSSEARDGHNWENWRDRLREGLSFLFPGPLWFVYE
jgi:enterochelin esterase family protein